MTHTELIEHLEKRRQSVKSELTNVSKNADKFGFDSDIRRASHLRGRMIELDHVIGMIQIASQADLDLPLERAR